jgi:hypothetical protein
MATGAEVLHYFAPKRTPLMPSSTKNLALVLSFVIFVLCSWAIVHCDKRTP